MLLAGSMVGFAYNAAGIAGILAIDGATYFVSAICLHKLRRGYVSPRQRSRYPHEYSEATEATAERSEEHTSELQSPCNLVCRLLLEKKKSKDQPEHECM